VLTDREQATSRDGTTIAYDVVGDGPGIVLVPGALQSGHHYAALARCLADAFTVYCVDRRGRAGSGSQRPDHSIQVECEDLIAVLEKTSTNFVFGHSSGAVVALQTALRHQIVKLAVYEPPVQINGSVPSGFMPAFERALAAGRKPDALAILGKGLHADRKVDKLPTFALKLLMRLASRGTTPELRELIEATPSFPAEHRMITGLDPIAYQRLEPETLILLGDRSPDYLARAASFLADTAPSAQFVVLTGLDHSGPEQQAPHRVARELRAFFAPTAPDQPHAHKK
jgi:pimeloyl-ACP methyl ester carboxylesterase